jgi:hypothetical protein
VDPQRTTTPRGASPDADAALLSEALDIPEWALRPISREPLGAGTVAGFLIGGSGPSAGEVAYVDSSGLRVPEETGMVLEGTARVWMHPADPHLPALAPTAFGDAAATLLARLGIEGAQLPEIVGYRPGRRAVLRVRTAERDVWVKVVRPRRIERVVSAHAALRDHGLPVPAVRGWSPHGLMVLDAADGDPATEAPWQPDRLLDGVSRLREVLAGIRLDWPARTSLRERMPWYLDRLRAQAPQRAAQLAAIDDAVDRIEPPTLDAGGATVHGDLHLGQLFLESGAVTGLIDVDTAGHGAPEDDSAAFIAHAAASALLTERIGGESGRIWRLADAAHARWAQDDATRALVAVQLLGHAVGAVTGGDAERGGTLIDLAERAVRDPKSPLIAAFGAA